MKNHIPDQQGLEVLGHLIYNHNHLDDARIQQEIARSLYAPALGNIHIVHAYNGEGSLGYIPYIEDKFICLRNRGHFQGTVDLIDAGIRYFTRARIRGLRYVLVTAADTWCLNVNWLRSILSSMLARGQVIATCSWGTSAYPAPVDGFATDFFVIDLDWNSRCKIWPIDFQEYRRKFIDFHAFHYTKMSVEAAFQYTYYKAILQEFDDNVASFKRDILILRLNQREPIRGADGRRLHQWPSLGLYTNPFPLEKQNALRELKVHLGPNAEQLKRATDLRYYNKEYFALGQMTDPKDELPNIHRSSD